jgi:DNA-directed RNA polymerase specialized sigma24 family protein
MNNASQDGSVTVWLAELKAGNAAAVQPLWDGYFARLVRLARARLWAVSRVAADEEDVALSAFNSFCRAVTVGRFPRLDDRDDLWQVLFHITTCKAINLVRRERCEIRGGGRVMHSSAVGGGEESALDRSANAVFREPVPDEVVEVTEACGRLLGLLSEKKLRSVAIWKMEGYTNSEVAEMLGKSIPTVERKLARIRTIWEREAVR